jgi:hypothetical protein
MSKEQATLFDRPMSTVGDQYYGLNKSTLDHIVKLTMENFFGSLTLKFENGKIVNIKKETNIKP